LTGGGGKSTLYYDTGGGTADNKKGIKKKNQRGEAPGFPKTITPPTHRGEKKIYTMLLRKIPKKRKTASSEEVKERNQRERRWKRIAQKGNLWEPDRRGEKIRSETSNDPHPEEPTKPSQRRSERKEKGLPVCF